MKLISWNVNGIRAVLNKGVFLNFVEKENPDLLCLQETKAHPEQVGLKLPQFPCHYWSAARKKGYAGTAVFSRIKPLSVSYGMKIDEQDQEGRLITLEFTDFFLVNVYTPNSARGLTGLDYRQKWDADFLGYLKKLEGTKPVLFCGDLNVAHTPMDLANPKENYNRTAGYTQVEIDAFTRLLNYGFLDSFREFNKEGGNYTWWSYMFNARAKNIGWRLDYFLISPSLRPRLKDSFILKEVGGSDHCPVGIVLE